ncbi:hypothetical protein [Chondromyces apiculatus]|uniref:SnoaL-like domain-containing protein n=1 Tax=Chondromyces apiculatus DSM 436 TaxID=1192034 RepID=A0A017TD36_9BACT|nr:hypothetical protein [Chondromyces apiculatus]EYF06730.1 Hypothetical protein CAP_1427 [Chondromyces apiculatus DSM 436]
MHPDVRSFFEGYVAAYNRSLGDAVDATAIRSHFAEHFLGAGPNEVSLGNNDGSFTETLEQGYAFYRSIGTRRMRLRDVAVTPIDDAHVMVRVFYGADYARPESGEPLTIDFDVTYILQLREAGPVIIAFIAGDEMALYEKYGLKPAGQPSGSPDPARAT